MQRGDTQLLQRWSSACTGVGRVGGLMGVGDINDHERRRLEEEVGGLVENGLQSEWFILFLPHVFFPATLRGEIVWYEKWREKC